MWCAEADSNSPSAGQKGNPHGQLQLGRDLGPVVGRYTSASATHAGWQLLQMNSSQEVRKLYQMLHGSH